MTDRFRAVRDAYAHREPARRWRSSSRCLGDPLPSFKVLPSGGVGALGNRGDGGHRLPAHGEPAAIHAGLNVILLLNPSSSSSVALKKKTGQAEAVAHTLLDGPAQLCRRTDPSYHFPGFQPTLADESDQQCRHHSRCDPDSGQGGHRLRDCHRWPYLAVLFGAAGAFSAPWGYQTNLMVFGQVAIGFLDVARYGFRCPVDDRPGCLADRRQFNL